LIQTLALSLESKNINVAMFFNNLNKLIWVKTLKPLTQTLILKCELQILNLEHWKLLKLPIT